MNAGGYTTYGAAYITLYPKFECKKNGIPIIDGSETYDKECIPSYFCVDSSAPDLPAIGKHGI